MDFAHFAHLHSINATLELGNHDGPQPKFITFLSKMKRQTTFQLRRTPTRTLFSVLTPIVIILAKISGGLSFHKLRVTMTRMLD